jgi:hypothetical protein
MTGPLNNDLISKNTLTLSSKYGFASVTCSLLTVSNC